MLKKVFSYFLLSFLLNPNKTYCMTEFRRLFSGIFQARLIRWWLPSLTYESLV